VSGRQAVLGIDLGTSGVKVLLADLDAAVLGRGSGGYLVRAPAVGQAESDPGDWWRAICLAVRAALAEAGDVEVVAAAAAGQMHGVVLADGRGDGGGAGRGDGRGGGGDVIRPAILWLDQRAGPEGDRYAELPEALTAGLGNRPSAGMAGPILRWLVTHEPENVKAARWALQPKDWVRLRLTGLAATDPTDASGTLLFDLAAGTWATGLIGALGLPGEKLPPVRGSADVAGRLLPGPAADLGLPPGIPVAIGAADTAAALHAVGLRDDEAMLTLGSGGQWAVSEAEFRPTATTNLYRAVSGGYYRLAPVQNVGVTLDWVRTLLGASWDEFYGTASRPPRPDMPVFQPYLTPERWDPTATGAWTGLTLAHQREDLLRSALDGVAALLKRRLDDLRAAGHDPQSVILGGGGATHQPWRDLLADTLALPLRPPSAAWPTATGAARLAAQSLSGCLALSNAREPGAVAHHDSSIGGVGTDAASTSRSWDPPVLTGGCPLSGRGVCFLVGSLGLAGVRRVKSSPD
jgi:xylulokinase